MMKKTKIQKIEQSLVRVKKVVPITTKDFLSTGSTLLNLAMTGRINRGFLKGKYYFLVGDSQSGKTFLALTCLAEASINPEFKDYRFIFDNGEGGALMNIAKFFGKSVEKHLEPPALDKEGNSEYSQTVEQFYFHLTDILNDKRPFIYILDSMDVLSSELEQDKFEEQKKAHEDGKSVSGSYGDGKAKINSQNLRQILGPLERSKSILIIINQTRDSLGFGFEKKTRSGGHALTFYACMELWSSVVGKIKKTVRGTQRQIGTFCQVRVKKNRISGKDRTITIPIYWSIGFDDIGACVDYLVEEKAWKSSGKGNITAESLGVEMSREKLIQHIEEKGLEKDVHESVSDVWDEIEEACEIKRKAKYQ
jgi:RecA/RadA recombinase